jgi:hypothetical protein
VHIFIKGMDNKLQFRKDDESGAFQGHYTIPVACPEEVFICADIISYYYVGPEKGVL